jgi:hypothetical protein
LLELGRVGVVLGNEPLGKPRVLTPVHHNKSDEVLVVEMLD